MSRSIQLLPLLLVLATGASAAFPELQVNRGERILEFDFPELLVGTAEYDEGPTGTTVFWDAVLSSVPEQPAPAMPAAAGPPTEELELCAGDDEFSESFRFGVRVRDGKLIAMYGGISQLFFRDPEHESVPAEGGDFYIDLPARDVVRFEVVDGAVVGATLNPRPWAVHATRVTQD